MRQYFIAICYRLSSTFYPSSIVRDVDLLPSVLLSSNTEFSLTINLLLFIAWPQYWGNLTVRYSANNKIFSSLLYQLTSLHHYHYPMSPTLFAVGAFQFSPSIVCEGLYERLIAKGKYFTIKTVDYIENHFIINHYHLTFQPNELTGKSQNKTYHINAYGASN